MAKRRPSGDGMVRKKDGKWEARIVVGHKNDGSPIFRYVYAKTQKELNEKLLKKKNEYHGIELTEDSNMTIGEWLDKWLEKYASLTLRENTLTGYRRIVNNYVKPNIGDKPIAFITANDLQKLYVKLKNSGRLHYHPEFKRELSNGSVLRVHTMLHKAFDDAIKEGLIPKNPTLNTNPPKKKKTEMKVLNDEQLEKFMKAIEQDEIWYDFFYTELTTGLRRGEILGLQWDDINFKTGELHIQRQAQCVDEKLVISDPKTETSKRTIILPNSVLKVLSELKEKTNSKWVFPSPVNEDMPRNPQTVYKRMQQILERAGCKKVRFHDLRHTFATTALANGMDVKTLSTMIGHVSAQTTLDIYSHSTEEMKRNAAKKIERTIGRNESIKEEDEETPDQASKKSEMAKFEPTKGKYRKPGTGCITKINDNLYEGRYSPRLPNGKRVSRNIYAKTREECETLLTELIKEMKAEIQAEKERLKQEHSM